MRQYDPQQPVLFSHIPKCAGSSFVRLLRDWFGEEYHKLNQDERRDIILPRVPTQDRKGRWLPQVRCIHGHFNHGRGYGLPSFYPEVQQYFSILRDPFDLAVSMYFFAKGRSRRGEFWFRGQCVDINQQFPNVEDYVQAFPYWFYDHLPQDVTLDNYEERMRSRFVYLGIFEDLQNSVDHLAMILGKPKTQLPHFNVSVYDEPVPEHLREGFYRDYPLLKKIYDLAVSTYRLPGYTFPGNGSPALVPTANSADRME